MDIAYRDKKVVGDVFCAFSLRRLVSSVLVDIKRTFLWESSDGKF
jgi:hypothetical protein